MANTKYGLRELRFLADNGHAWLEVPTADVTASGYRPSEYSHRDDHYSAEVPGRVSTLTSSFTYLEEDCDVRGFIEALGVEPYFVADVVTHISRYVPIDRGRDSHIQPPVPSVRNLPRCSGIGFISPFGRA